MAAINEKGLLGKFLVWRVRYIKEKQFIVMLSILVGIVTGLAGVVLKNMVHFTHMFFTERMQVVDFMYFSIGISSFIRQRSFLERSIKLNSVGFSPKRHFCRKYLSIYIFVD